MFEKKVFSLPTFLAHFHISFVASLNKLYCNDFVTLFERKIRFTETFLFTYNI